MNLDPKESYHDSLPPNEEIKQIFKRHGWHVGLRNGSFLLTSAVHNLHFRKPFIIRKTSQCLLIISPIAKSYRWKLIVFVENNGNENAVIVAQSMEILFCSLILNI